VREDEAFEHLDSRAEEGDGAVGGPNRRGFAGLGESDDGG